MKFLLIYLIICLIETIILKWMVDTGRWDKIEDEKYGEDAWKNRIRQYIPENPIAAVLCIFIAFFISTPALIILTIKNIFV